MKEKTNHLEFGVGAVRQVFLHVLHHERPKGHAASFVHTNIYVLTISNAPPGAAVAGWAAARHEKERKSLSPTATARCETSCCPAYQHSNHASFDPAHDDGSTASEYVWPDRERGGRPGRGAD